MTEVRFYHLKHTRLDAALPGILMQAYKRSMRAVVKMSDKKALQHMDQHLWSFHPDSFLPHSMDHHPADQPVWLTLKDENPNNSTLLILVDGIESTMIDQFDLVCEIFDDTNETAVLAARKKWGTFKNQGFKLTYYQQNEKGGWEEKLST